MLNKIRLYIFCSIALVFSSLKAQNCWEYEEHVPVNRGGGSVVISEVYFDTHYSERIGTKYHHIGEFVEFFNSSTENIDMSGWKITDHQTEFIFPQGSVISSGDILVVAYAGRVIDDMPGTNTLFGTDKFVELFPEALGYEQKIVLQNNFVLFNEKATVKLYNGNGFLIDQVAYKRGVNDQVPGLNFQGDFTNGDGGVFNGPIYSNLQEQLEAQGWGTDATDVVFNFKKAIYIEDVVNYYDHEDLDEPYEVADATPFSIPFTITLLPPSDVIDAFPPPPPPNLYNFNVNYNHIVAESYDVLGGLTTKTGAYFNELGNPTINYSLDIKANKVWGSKIFYDGNGRPALQTLTAPSCDGFVINPTFLFGGFRNYVDDSDYNSLTDIDNLLLNNYNDNDFSSLKRYYSDENTNEPFQSTSIYPYTRKVYDKLNPGKIVKTIGGNKIDGEWKSSYSYVMPAAQEMYYIFGKDYFDGEQTAHGEKVEANFFKTVVIDIDGNERVTFSDAQGNQIATARSGGSTAVEHEIVALIDERGYVDVHIPKNITSVSFIGGPAIYTVYDLKTGEHISPFSVTGGNLYRIEIAPPTDENAFYAYIDSSGDINTVGSAGSTAGAKGIRYNVNYYDYSLNYYDNVGNLKKNIQPLGFNTSSIQNQILNTVTHSMASTYKYNVQKLLIETSSPDEGISKHKYRSDNQVRFSQNSEQALLGEVSFTDYDAQARSFRSGVGLANFNVLDPDQDNVTSGLKDIKETFYDLPDATLITELSNNGLNPNNYEQTYVSGNISKTSVSHPDISETWYSYDIYGRVKWTVQKINGLGLKTVHYEYDYKGNLKKMIYQKDTSSESFIHQFTYDLNNNMSSVSTSTNGSTFKEQAKYIYYKSGQLKRKEIANGNQGIDYIYTLQGSLKSINEPNLTNDPGNDLNDIFGLTLDYYSGDYLRTGSPIKTSSQGINRYDGNIKASRWSTKDLTPNGSQDAYQYAYNEDKWLVEATFGSSDPNANITTGSDYSVSGISYDANGNLLSLNRRKNTVVGNNEMDDFTYNYNAQTNQLNYVNDVAPSPTDADDLVDQSNNNYNYNTLGQLVSNVQDDVAYSYNASGLVTEVKKLSTGITIVKFIYDDKNNRVAKETYTPSGSLSFKTYYVRDQIGNPMAIYNNTTLTEHPIIGTSRIGVHYRQDGSDTYQLADHLGNVRALLNQEENDNPIVYQEDFNTGTSVSPWAHSSSNGVLALEVEGQKMKCTINRNYRGARLNNIPLDAGKEYQFSYTLERHSMQARFQALLYKAGSNWWTFPPVYNSGAITESGDHTFTYTPAESSNYILILRSQIIPGYPNNTDYIQPNTFYLDNILIKDISVDVFGYSDYYPFGMKMPNRVVEGDYRYAYQGQEKDPETNKEAFNLRLWDGRIGRWLTVDPAKEFVSPYIGMGNNPIRLTDLDGDCTWCLFEMLKQIQEWMKNDPEGFIKALYGAKPYGWTYFKNPKFKAIRGVFDNLGEDSNTSSSELYTLAIGEGFNIHLVGSKKYKIAPKGYGLSVEVNGFDSLGVDRFAEDRDLLVALGVLSSSFNEGDEYERERRRNEQGEIVYSGVFSNVPNGLTAFEAVTNRRRALVLDHGDKYGYGTPTDDQLFFWTYYYFQGQGRGEDELEANGGWDFSGMKFDLVSQNPKGVGSKAYRRLLTWRYIQLRGY